MGWLAAGCCTLIAGYVLYKLLIQEEGDQRSETSRRLSATLVPELRLQTDQQPAPSKGEKGPSAERPVLPQTPTFATIHSETNADDESVAAVEKVLPKIAERAPLQLPAVTRVRPSSPPRLRPATFGTMSAPPRPGNGVLRPPPSAAASLRIPPTKVLANASMAPTSSIMPPGKRASRKIILEPGHSPLDWAALTSNPNSQLRGKDVPENLIRVTPAQLKLQNGRKGRDAWTVYHGKVYNITPYIPFHPGGATEIMRGAGKDSVQLFMEVHPWVNWDGMLSECLVGILVGDDEADTSTNKSGGLDEMD